MKKMKKVLAMLLALAMVLGMSVTTFADTKDSATITVSDAEGATLSYVQVIQPQTTAPTGWEFSTDAIEEDYTSAFGVTDDQVAIVMLIKAANATAKVPSAYATVAAATPVQINQALDNVLNGVALGAMANPQTVTSAGVYAIKATQEGFTYKAMAAYVGFDAVENYEYPSLVDTTLGAKKIPTTIVKADNDADNAVAIDQKVTYTLTTTFPYFNQNATDKYFAISDTITGASYTDLENATVTIGGDEVEADFVQNGNSFTVDLSAYIDNANSNANETVIVTYEAIVDETQVVNGATSHVGEDEYDSNEIELFTGKITLVKHDEAGEAIVLENAGFEVKKGEETLTFVQNDENAAVYTYDEAGTITEIFTDENGEVVIEGLDIGTYTFVEKTAPAGYSVNETPVNVELVVTDKNEANEATAIFEADGKMADTKLNALPATGGMGTTIFTIGGCAIMIAAAALLLANRKKAAR